MVDITPDVVAHGQVIDPAFAAVATAVDQHRLVVPFESIATHRCVQMPARNRFPEQVTGVSANGTGLFSWRSDK